MGRHDVKSRDGDAAARDREALAAAGVVRIRGSVRPAESHKLERGEVWDEPHCADGVPKLDACLLVLALQTTTGDQGQ